MRKFFESVSDPEAVKLIERLARARTAYKPLYGSAIHGGRNDTGVQFIRALREVEEKRVKPTPAL